MKPSVLVDTGPLVAILSKRDSQHDRCVAELDRLPAPLCTCWPVLTEALWLLRRDARTTQALLKSFEAGFLRLLDLDQNSLEWIAGFLARYQDAGAQLADAALVYLAERHGIESVFTLDHRHFSIYRLGRNRRLRVIPEP